jgi:hypothetical protein
LRSKFNFVPKNKLDRDLSERVLLNSKLYITTGRALDKSYDLTQQAWLNLEELCRYLHCGNLVYL